MNSILRTVIFVFAVGVASANASQLEQDRIDSLLQKVDIPVDIRQEFVRELASHPDIAVSDGDMTVMWYITKDTVRFGVIPMPAGQGMKQWTLPTKLDGSIFYCNYQLVSMDEGRAIGLRIVRDFDGFDLYLLLIVILFVTVLIIGLIGYVFEN